MGKKKGVLFGCLAFVLLIGGAYLLYNQLMEKAPAQTLSTEANGTEEEESQSNEEEQDVANSEDTSEQSKAPDFTVFDEDGNEVTLSDYFGKPIVVNFWASWCGPCKSEMPEFDKMYQKYGEEITFLMVNMTDGSRETEEIAKKYIEEEGFSFPIYYDLEMEAAYTYNVYSLPTTYFIGEDGVIVAQAKSALDEETLQKGIDMIYIDEKQ